MPQIGDPAINTVATGHVNPANSERPAEFPGAIQIALRAAEGGKTAIFNVVLSQSDQCTGPAGVRTP
jgi:hypothetical protein